MHVALEMIPLKTPDMPMPCRDISLSAFKQQIFLLEYDLVFTPAL